MITIKQFIENTGCEYDAHTVYRWIKELNLPMVNRGAPHPGQLPTDTVEMLKVKLVDARANARSVTKHETALAKSAKRAAYLANKIDVVRAPPQARAVYIPPPVLSPWQDFEATARKLSRLAVENGVSHFHIDVADGKAEMKFEKFVEGTIKQ